MRLSNLYSNLIYNDLIKSSKSEAVPSRPVSFLYNRLRASETAFAARQISIPISLFENPIFTSRQMRYSCSLMLWALYKASLNPTSIHPSSSSACAIRLVTKALTLPHGSWPRQTLRSRQAGSRVRFSLLPHCYLPPLTPAICLYVGPPMPQALHVCKRTRAISASNA